MWFVFLNAINGGVFLKVIKRNGLFVQFNPEKIYIAIKKAMKFGSGLVEEKIARQISLEIKKEFP